MSNIDFDKYITVFTDASYCNDTRSTGYAIWIKYGGGITKRFTGSSTKPTGSNQAEELALKQAMKYVMMHVDYSHKHLVINSDCLGALESLVIPEELKRDLAGIRLKHVKAHQNSVNRRSAVNEWCDREAKREMRNLRTQLENIQF